MKFDDVMAMMDAGATHRQVAKFFDVTAEALGGFLYNSRGTATGFLSEGIEAEREVIDRAAELSNLTEYRCSTDKRLGCPPIGRSSLEKPKYTKDPFSPDAMRANPCRMVAIRRGLISA